MSNSYDGLMDAAIKTASLDDLKAAAALMDEMKLKAIKIAIFLGSNGIGDAHLDYDPLPEKSDLEIDGDDAILHWFSEDYGPFSQRFPATLLLGNVNGEGLNAAIFAFADQEIKRIELKKKDDRELAAMLEEEGRRNFMAAMPELVKDLMEQQKSLQGKFDANQDQIVELLKQLTEGNHG